MEVDNARREQSQQAKELGEKIAAPRSATRAGPSKAGQACERTYDVDEMSRSLMKGYLRAVYVRIDPDVQVAY